MTQTLLTANVYSQPNCPYCTQAIQLLTSKNYVVVEYKIGRDLQKEEFFSLFPNARTVPQITIGMNHIGGFSELKEYFKTV